MLKRARDAHKFVDFNALAAGPNVGGPWKRIEAADRFVVFRGMEAKLDTGPQVMCAGRLDAAIEEVVSILCPHTEAKHNAVMTALHEKHFLSGTLERSVPCNDAVDNQDELSEDHGEHLTVKTSSFARSSLFGNNEQWCYTAFFQRKRERDGFTISLNSLGRNESIPARMAGTQTRVNQLHDLTASYLVDLDPGSRGLRVVFNAKFLAQMAARDRSTCNQTPESPSYRNVEFKAQTRRLLVLARGVTRLPELVRCRRFGFQVPADLGSIEVSNPRCPCCTRSMCPVKMTLSVAASAVSNRSLTPLKTDTRRCYLCGYLVCIDCWSGERMKNMSGRIAAIVVCSRCHANVDACDYSDISADANHGPAHVVEDHPESTKASLLIDFFSNSLEQAPVGSSERSNVLSVVRTLLHQDDEGSDEDSDEDSDEEFEDVAMLEQYDADAVEKVDQFLRDESKFPLLVAYQLAPSEPRQTKPDHHVDVRDLELICQLAAKTLGCSNAMISVMSASHEHILASTDVNFAGAAVPRDYTMCQHQLMSQDPLVLIHPEADVRLQAIQTIKLMALRSYIGFPVTAPVQDSSDQIAVGTLCCIDSKPHHQLTRAQYATMQNLARTASQLVQMKGLQIQQHAAPAS